MFFREKFDQIIEVPNNKWFNQIKGFEQIPTHSIIYKTKPGMGATYGEILAERDSIVILPHVSIIKNKHKQYKDKHQTFAVYGDDQNTKATAIINYLAFGPKHKKFLTTPRGLEKIKTAVEMINHLQGGNPGEIDHPKPEQVDHLKGWRKLSNFAGEDFQFSADFV